MSKDRDPTGSRDPAIDEMLGEVFAEDMAAEGILTDTTGHKEKDEPPKKLNVDIITTPNLVVMEFSMPIRWLNMPPELAIDLGNALRKWGRKLIKKQHGE
jgi:hypothetical protein